MSTLESEEVDGFIHNTLNPLNSITLHAELGKMLVEENASNEQIKEIFSVILQQCASCEQILTEMRTTLAE